MNIASILENMARNLPDQPAVLCGETTVTYARFNREAGRIAAGLVRRGVAPGESVALCAPNSFEWLAFYFGVLKTGAVAVTFSHLLTPGELTPILQNCRPKVLLAGNRARLGGVGRPDGLATLVCDDGDVSFAQLAAEGAAPLAAVERERDDVAAILYTGGTTGTPKGAMLTHANLQAAVLNVAYHERSTHTDRALCFLPLNHVFAQVHIMLATVFSGGALVLQNGFDLDAVLAAVASHRVTKFFAVPTIYIRLLELPDLSRALRSVRYCFSAAASMAKAVVRAWKKATGLDIHESYGMTESAAMVTFNHLHRHVVGSVGTATNLVEVRICDTDGRRLPDGETGEICIRGPNVMKAYLNHPQETAAAFRGDWFRSGDLGVMDADGYLYIVDRLKDMIVTGGENVYAREVEEALYTLPEVSECAVIGLPDPEYGERVTAVIVPQAGRRLDAAALRAALKKRLAPFKVPRAYLTVEALPRNNAGKLLKRELKKRFA